jgi:hypothetical protein
MLICFGNCCVQAKDVGAGSKREVVEGRSWVYISHVVSPNEFYFQGVFSSLKKGLDK